MVDFLSLHSLDKHEWSTDPNIDPTTLSRLEPCISSNDTLHYICLGQYSGRPQEKKYKYPGDGIRCNRRSQRPLATAPDGRDRDAISQSAPNSTPAARHSLRWFITTSSSLDATSTTRPVATPVQDVRIRDYTGHRVAGMVHEPRWRRSPDPGSERALRQGM